MVAEQCLNCKFLTTWGSLVQICWTHLIPMANESLVQPQTIRSPALVWIKLMELWTPSAGCCSAAGPFSQLL